MIIAIITWKAFCIAIAFTLLFLLCCIIFASFKVNSPRRYHCWTCGHYRNELGERSDNAPIGVESNDIASEHYCDLCAERLTEKARQHHN